MQTKRLVPRSALPWASCLLFALGCARGQIGGDVGPDGEASSDPCEDVETSPVTGSEAIPDKSFVLNDLEAAISGEHEVSMRWNGSESSSEVDVDPSVASDTTIQVIVDVQPETGRWVTRAEKQSSGAGPAIDIITDCRGELRVDAEVEVMTGNGALDETFTATFVMREGELASTTIPIDLDALTGDFTAEAQAENAEVAQMQLSLQFALGQPSGRLTGMITTNDGQVASASGIEFAHFPSDNDCSSGSPIPANAESAAALSAALAEHTSFDFTWQGEEPFQFDVEPTLGSLCLVLSNDGASLTGPLSLAVSSDGSQLAGTWPLSVSASLVDGELSRIEVTRDAYLANIIPASEFADTTGITGITSDASDLTYSFGYSIDLSENLPATGELTVMEAGAGSCGGEGGAPSGGGAAAPGCTGFEFKEIKNATFVER